MKLAFFIASILFTLISGFMGGFSIMAFINDHILDAIYFLLVANILWKVAEYFEKEKEKYDGQK